MPLILPGNVASATGGGYEVANSCRFNQPDSPYMSKTHGSAGNQRTFTVSFWYKRMKTGTNDIVMTTTDGGSSFLSIAILGGGTYINKLQFYWYDGSTDYGYHSARLFRDFSAWYHVVFAVDTTQGTASNRIKLYINGTQETLTATYGAFPQNHDAYFNKDNVHYIGYDHDSAGAWLNGYLAEVVVLDGTAASPTSFGEFDEDSPTIWKPIDVSGLTFGTNGFYLDFEDSSNLGNDANGGTDWTESNLAAADQCTDTPTNNFCTLNPLAKGSSAYTFTEGNCIGLANAADWNGAVGTLGVENGKWYWEIKLVSADADGNNFFGVCGEAVHNYLHQTNVQDSTTGHVLWALEGEISINNTHTGSYFNTKATNDIFGIALDLDSGTQTIQFYRNGSTDGSAANIPSNMQSGFIFPHFVGNSSAETATFQCNFGNPSFSISSGNADANGYGNFEYAVPSGFYALCTKNLAEYG